MGSLKAIYFLPFFILIGVYAVCNCYDTARIGQSQTTLVVNASKIVRKIPSTLFGIFFEEINHAGAGGLWAELVSNRGFEFGGRHSPSLIKPWSIIGDELSINVSTDLSSCFERNKVALRMDVLCDSDGPTICPSRGVGIYNPGFWGMNIEQGKTYKVVFYVRSSGSIDLSVSFTSSTGAEVLATSNVMADEVADWTKIELTLEANSSNSNSRLQLTTTKKGAIWFDQVSAMPTDTYKGHGFRKDLFDKLMLLEPRFIRFPGGCFVEGEHLANAFRWKETVGPWEDRPGHWGDVWNYWTDDGIGYLEFLQLAEDLGAAPVWVINNGISHQESVEPAYISAFVQEMLDSIEFARGDSSSKWGSLRASMGHPEPFDLKYVAIGNEDCGKPYYRENYMKFYNALKKAYPDMQAISNCDASSTPLNHPADLYDFHIYTSANDMFSKANRFDRTRRDGPKAFVSEYAVTDRKDAGTGSLLAALAEAAFLIGLEKNSDVVEMASYAPLFVNTNDRRWNPDAIVFNSSHSYGTPSYWMQQYFTKSSGATLLSTAVQGDSSHSLVASVISWKNDIDNKNYVTIKIVNFGSSSANLKISIDFDKTSFRFSGSSKTILTSSNVLDENSLDNPSKVVPRSSTFELSSSDDTNVVLQPHSLTSFDLLQEQPTHIQFKEATHSALKSSF